MEFNLQGKGENPYFCMVLADSRRFIRRFTQIIISNALFRENQRFNRRKFARNIWLAILVLTLNIESNKLEIHTLWNT